MACLLRPLVRLYGAFGAGAQWDGIEARSHGQCGHQRRRLRSRRHIPGEPDQSHGAGTAMTCYVGRHHRHLFARRVARPRTGQVTSSTSRAEVHCGMVRNSQPGGGYGEVSTRTTGAGTCVGALGGSLTNLVHLDSTIRSTATRSGFGPEFTRDHASIDRRLTAVSVRLHHDARRHRPLSGTADE